MSSEDVSINGRMDYRGAGIYGSSRSVERACIEVPDPQRVPSSRVVRCGMAVAEARWLLPANCGCISKSHLDRGLAHDAP